MKAIRKNTKLNGDTYGILGEFRTCPQEATTVYALLQLGAQTLAQNGYSDDQLTSEAILSHVLCENREAFYRDPQRKVNEEHVNSFFKLLYQRKKGMPLAYLVGEKDFFSLPFYVNPNTLIPRPETELLVQEVIDTVKNEQISLPHVLDVGTGTGAIAIAIKKNVPHSLVKAIDMSPKALNVAKRNSIRHGTKIGLICGNLLESISQPFDIVVANLPYIAQKEMEDLPLDVREYEPHPALIAGEDGLDLIRQLIKETPLRLKDRGKLILEVGMGQALQVVELLKSSGFWVKKIVKDLSSIERMVVGVKRGLG